MWVTGSGAELGLVTGEGQWQTHTSPFSQVRALSVDGQGSLWVAGDAVARLKPDGDWETYSLEEWLYVFTSIQVDGQGLVWLGASSGLYTLRPSGSVLSKIDMVEGVVTALRVDAQDRVWVGQYAGLMVFYPDEPGTMSLAGTSITAIALDTHDRVWAGTARGLKILAPDGQWQSYPTDNSSLAEQRVSALAIDAQGQAWVGSPYYGLSLLSPEEQWQTYTTANSGLINNDIRHIELDRQGRVWILTADNAIQVFNPQARLPPKTLGLLAQAQSILRWLGISILMVAGAIGIWRWSRNLKFTQGLILAAGIILGTVFAFVSSVGVMIVSDSIGFSDFAGSPLTPGFLILATLAGSVAGPWGGYRIGRRSGATRVKLFGAALTGALAGMFAILIGLGLSR